MNTNTGASKLGSVFATILFLWLGGLTYMVIDIYMHPQNKNLDNQQATKVVAKKINPPATSETNAVTTTPTIDNTQLESINNRLAQLEIKLDSIQKIGETVSATAPSGSSQPSTTNSSQPQSLIQTGNGELKNRLEKMESTISTIDERLTALAESIKKYSEKSKSDRIADIEKSKTVVPVSVQEKSEPTLKSSTVSETSIEKPSIPKKRIQPKTMPIAKDYKSAQTESYDTYKTSAISPSFRPKMTAAKETIEPTFHEVKAGEELPQISKQYGMVYEDLLRLNNLRPGEDIFPGQVLIVESKIANPVDSPSTDTTYKNSYYRAATNYQSSDSGYVRQSLYQISMRYAPTYEAAIDNRGDTSKLAPGLGLYPW